MGLFGGSSQSTSQLTSSIAFNPVIQLGDGNRSDNTQKAEQTATQTPTLKDELALSAAWGGGQASSGLSDTTSATDNQPTATSATTSASNPLANVNPTYLGIGAIVLGGYMLISQKGKKKT